MLFSPSRLEFCDPALRAVYESEENWPEDVQAIETDVFEQYGYGSPPVGYRLAADAAGQPCWEKVDTAPADKRRHQAIDWLDATADRIRAADRSVGQYLDAEYQLVAQALAMYRSNPEADDVPEAIESYASAERLTVAEAAQEIAEAAARAQELLQAVRRIRLAGKAVIRDGSDDADMMATAQPYINQLEALTCVQ